VQPRVVNAVDATPFPLGGVSASMAWRVAGAGDGSGLSLAPAAEKSVDHNCRRRHPPISCQAGAVHGRHARVRYALRPEADSERANTGPTIRCSTSYPTRGTGPRLQGGRRCLPVMVTRGGGTLVVAHVCPCGVGVFSSRRRLGCVAWKRAAQHGERLPRPAWRGVGGLASGRGARRAQP